MAKIDLHMHSRYSDGTLTVEELVELAHENGVEYLSLTDHDTVAGIPDALAACEKHHIKLIPGVELSVHVDSTEVHLLAYNFDWKDRKFLEFLSGQKSDRERRLGKILEKLAQCGVNLAKEDVLEFIDDDTAPGRPHIAKALVKKGFVKDTQTAFDKYLKKGKPAFESRKKIHAKDIIEWVHRLGGFTSLAHPGLIKKTEIIHKMIDWGVKALELYHPDHHEHKRSQLQTLIEKHQLKATAGSDFHDLHYHHGIQPGQLKFPEELEKTLIQELGECA